MKKSAKATALDDLTYVFLDARDISQSYELWPRGIAKLYCNRNAALSAPISFVDPKSVAVN
jgi:hypothetical protein